ncbi:Mitogen-activated protein kinase kinase kinase 2 [Trichoplax sp. H2]|nr:Mitogen-activated protein kinase kinase kinase 2 [Trichoplax sp. H2]|eukprot:RDD45204.1 Mitogen-activated protein kinase kinase kinase 2 [Trichoplax sp. H2]
MLNRIIPGDRHVRGASRPSHTMPAIRVGVRNRPTIRHDGLPWQNDIRVKFQYQYEKRVCQLPRPLQYEDLAIRVRKLFGRDLAMNFVMNEAEMIMTPILSQSHVDKVVDISMNNPNATCVRILLTISDTSETNSYSSEVIVNDCDESQNDTDGTTEGDSVQLYDDIDKEGTLKAKTFDIKSTNAVQEIPGRDSPPPGFNPDEEIQTPVHLIAGEGTFIPENYANKDDSQHQFPPTSPPVVAGQYGVSSSDLSSIGSSSSLNSSQLSITGGHSGENISRSTSRVNRGWDNSSYDYAELSGKSGTFPSRRFVYDNTITDESYIDGRQTFPRAQLLSVNSVSNSEYYGSSGSLHDHEQWNGGIGNRRPSDVDVALQRLRDLTTSDPKSFRWQKEKLLGAGAFGQVYLGYDKTNKRYIAIKQVKTYSNDHARKEVEALKAEIELLRKLRHDRIVSYYGAEYNEIELSILMEYMPGGSIFEYLRKNGVLPERANILLDSYGNVKLADFGSARRIKSLQTMSGLKSLHGTSYWISPEVAKGEGYGRKADIWSVGCTVVEMLTAHPPLREYEPLAAVFKIATEQIYPSLPEHSSESAKEFIRATFRRDTKSRPSAGDLLRYKFITAVR